MLTKEGILKAIQAREIEISPFDESQLNPNSYDLRLSPHLLTYKASTLDAKVELETEEQLMTADGFRLLPGELYLMATKEVTVSNSYIPCIEGRSSIGRLGISIHATAGFGDVGFCGTWTLEVTVVKPVIVYPNMRICQIYFEECDVIPDCGQLYRGKYHGQRKPRPSRIFTESREWTG